MVKTVHWGGSKTTSLNFFTSECTPQLHIQAYTGIYGAYTGRILHIRGIYGSYTGHIRSIYAVSLFYDAFSKQYLIKSVETGSEQFRNIVVRKQKRMVYIWYLDMFLRFFGHVYTGTEQTHTHAHGNHRTRSKLAKTVNTAKAQKNIKLKNKNVKFPFANFIPNF